MVVRGGPLDGRFTEPGGDADLKALRSLRRNAEQAVVPPYLLQRRLIGTLLRRRSERHLAALAQLGSGDVPDVLVTVGELLLRKEDWTRGLGSMLRPAGWEEAELGCAELESRVVKLTHPVLTATEVDKLARSLRLQGVRAGSSHMTPLAPVGKALGGAEPASPLPPREASSPGRVRVGIIDSGIVGDLRKDGWLDDVARTGDNVEDVTGDDGFLTRAAGHGTFVAGIVQRVAPQARITVVQANLDDGLASEIDVAGDLVRTITGHEDDPIRIVNLSFGSPTADDLPPLALEAAFEVIAEHEKEIPPAERALIFAAAGNYGDDRPVWPGAFRRVVAVGGLDPYLGPAAWSSRGHWVDASCVGEAVRSTYVAGTESPDFDPDDPDEFTPPNPWALWTGSSFAAPQFAGAVAARVEEEGETPREALSVLLAAGTTVPGFGQAIQILPSAQR